jgi:hypothetical protein
VVGGLLIVITAGGVGLFAYATAQSARPVEAAQEFCGDLKAQQYTSAYELLSNSYQKKMKEQQYVQNAQLQDQVDGTVQSCGPQSGSSSGFSLDFNRNTATISAQIVRKKTFTGNLSLIKQGGDWRIDSVPQSLQGTDLGPLDIGNTFCHDLGTGNFAAAWQEFSTSFKARFPETQYVSNIQQTLAQLSQQVGVMVKIAGCKLHVTTYAVSTDDSSASVRSDLIVQAGAQTVSQAQNMDFTKESDGWRIASLTNVG